MSIGSVNADDASSWQPSVADTSTAPGMQRAHAEAPAYEYEDLPPLQTVAHDCEPKLDALPSGQVRQA